MFPIRDENPRHGIPFFTVTLIAANVLLFFLQISQGPYAEAMVMTYGIVPLDLLGSFDAGSNGSLGDWKTLVTSMFLHGGVAHLLGNMWFLWLFGNNLEDTLGHWRFLLFYLMTGVMAGLVHIFLNPFSEVPTIGASGAISGILGGYLICFPRIRIKTLVTLGFFFTFVLIPAPVFLGLWLLMQFIGGFAGGTNIAFGAHIGGFFAGLVLMWLLSKPNRAARYNYVSRRLPRY